LFEQNKRGFYPDDLIFGVVNQVRPLLEEISNVPTYVLSIFTDAYELSRL